MSNYSDIVTVMNHTGTPSKAIKAKYALAKPNEFRKLLPVLLGPEPDGSSNAPVVLCYQFDGPAPIDTPHPSKKNWRCFKVESLTEVSIINFSTTPPFNSPNFPHKKLERQNCVDGDDIAEWRRKPYVQ